MSAGIILPLWTQITIAALLLTSAAFTVLGALGIVRFESFYLRMHPTAIVFTLGAWCVCVAVALFFTAMESRPALQALILIPLIIITMPITTVILARAVLFRWRNEGRPAPPSLSYTIVPGDLAPSPVLSPPPLQTDEQQEEQKLREVKGDANPKMGTEKEE